MKIKIDSRGRVTIPEAIRETIGFGDAAYLEVEGNKIIITREYDPIRKINEMIDDISKCEDKLKYIDILIETKEKMGKL